MTPHPEFAAFVAHLRAAPHDGVGWLALADWLDEHADPRAEFVRLSVALTTGQIPVEAWEITRDKLKRFTDCDVTPEVVLRVPHRIELGPFRVDRVAYLLPVAFRTYQSELHGAVAGRPPLGFGIVFPGHLDIPRGTMIEPALPPEDGR